MDRPIGISAIIPAYNREKTIARALDSALAQEYAAAEVIVIDDGSRDGTRNVVERYGSDVRYVYQENAGVAAARNKGVSLARYPWIAFLDSDDYWLPDHLKRMADAISATEERAALYFSDIIPTDLGEDSYWNLCCFRISEKYELRQDATDWSMMKRHPMVLETSVIRRESYIESGGIPQALVVSEDTFLFLKLCFLYPACAVSGFGAVVTSDCNESGRASQIEGSKRYECRKLLYKELLRFSSSMKEDHQREIRKGLVRAYLNAGRFFLRRKEFRSALTNICGSVGLNPMVSAMLVARMLGDYYSRKRSKEILT